MSGLTQWWWRADLFTKTEQQEVSHTTDCVGVTFRNFPSPIHYLHIWNHVLITHYQSMVVVTVAARYPTENLKLNL